MFHEKHLGVVLYSNFNFNPHIDQKIKKCNKMIGLIRRRLSVNLARNALFTIYKSFIRPHLDYDDILYDKPILAMVMSYMTSQAMIISKLYWKKFNIELV